MPSALPTPDACCPTCPETAVVNIPGAPGTDGTDGATWRSGSGVPSNGLGLNGDFYLNMDNGDVYLKSGGIYSLILNIVGSGVTVYDQALEPVGAVPGDIWIIP